MGFSFKLPGSKRLWIGLAIAAVIILAIAIGVPVGLTQRNKKSDDTPPASQSFYNPDRGLFTEWDIRASRYEPPTTNNFLTMTRKGNSVVLYPIYLDSYINSAIESTFLSNLATLLSSTKQAGLKAIIRFAYSNTINAKPADAPINIVQQHISQLTPILRANADVILLFQAGFIGSWGEWYYTQNYGDQGVYNSAQWEDRVKVIDGVLGMVPNKFVLLRIVPYKQRYLGIDQGGASVAPTVVSANAFGADAKARLGFHDDCFVGDENDEGTFRSTADIEFLKSETLYVPMTGESCSTSDSSSYTCPISLSRTAAEHYSLLNDDQYPAILEYWKKNGCFDDIVKNLGYRFIYSPPSWYTGAQTGTNGGKYRMTGWTGMGIRNTGNAAPFNAYGLDVILVPIGLMEGNGTMDGTGVGYVGQLSGVDVRFIAGGTSNYVVPEMAFEVDQSLVGGSGTYGV
ncbi:hypothetical protein HK097_004196, partial [Rhizophlyctis rosea]